MATERELHPPQPQSPAHCPVCGRPANPVITGRRKSMGARVPVWGPGPCPDPGCASRARAPTQARAQDA